MYKAEEGDFYTDTGADVSIIKESKIPEHVRRDSQSIVEINGVTPGECLTLGQVEVELNGLWFNLHVVPDDISIDTDGLLGWDVFERYNGQVNAADRCVRLLSITLPFECDEIYTIPPRTRQVIRARIKNSDEKTGYVPLQDLGPGILFGNFVATNQGGHTYAICINTNEEAVEVKPPEVELCPCETMPPLSDTLSCHQSIEETPTSGVSIERKMSSADAINEEKSPIHGALTTGGTERSVREARILKLNNTGKEDRATEVFKQIDPSTLAHLNKEEIEHVKELIKKRPFLFGLPGEKLRATHLVIHKIEVTTEVPIKAKRHRNPPAIKDEMQRQIDEYLKTGVIKPSESPYSSMM